jgi:hypothetical protein
MHTFNDWQVPSPQVSPGQGPLMCSLVPLPIHRVCLIMTSKRQRSARGTWLQLNPPSCRIPPGQVGVIVRTGRSSRVARDM